VLLMIGCSLGVDHKQLENSARRPSIISQSSSMERSSRCVGSLESLAESVVEHEASSVSSVGSSNSLIKLMEQMECLDCLGGSK